MKDYSIVRVGNEYVVQAGKTSVLKVASRRRAEQTITDAAELLSSKPTPDSFPAAELPAETLAERSGERDPGVMPEPPDDA